MTKIEFRENKILKLINVLSRKVPENELFSRGVAGCYAEVINKTKGL